MDQTLQARLIGATVLVALAVLLIPELLSGRKTVEPAADAGAAAPGSRTFTIELGGSGGQPSCFRAACSAVGRSRDQGCGGAGSRSDIPSGDTG